jgi:hypothetical protein
MTVANDFQRAKYTACYVLLDSGKALGAYIAQDVRQGRTDDPVQSVFQSLRLGLLGEEQVGDCNTAATKD